MATIGIDLGGTNIAAGVVDEQYRIIGRAKLKTNLPRPQEEILHDLCEVARMAAADAGLALSDIEWVGVGSPGTVNSDEGIVEYSNNIKFVRADIRGAIRKELDLPCYVANDANAAAYGELMAGAGKGARDFVAITLGTGVGGGVVMGGVMLCGFNFAGGELGHSVMIKDGEPCTCGRKGCFESYASATALIRQTKRAMEAHPESSMWALCEGTLDNAGGRTAFDGLRQGDPAATKVVRQYIDYLAVGLVNIVNIFQPSILCIGGGISNEKDEYLLMPLREQVEKHSYGADYLDKKTQVVRAALGNDAGIIGAALLGNL